MQSENKQLIEQAKLSLQGKWKLAIGTFLCYSLVSAILSSLKGFGSFVSLLLNGPFSVGLAFVSLRIARGQEYVFENIFEGFKHDFKRSLISYVLIVVYVILYSLLLIVPGIIKAISYSMTFYILAEDNTILPEAALEKSKQMMEGNKLKFFYLGLRFFGLGLLCILTLGIGLLWLVPLINVTTAKFYKEIRDEYYDKNNILHE